MIVLALEGSTSAAKAMLYMDGDMKVHAENYGSVWADGLKIDVDKAFGRLMSVGQSLLSQYQVTPDVITLSALWHGLLLLDQQGSPMAPYSTWADVAGNKSLNRYEKEEQTKKILYQKTGCPPHGSFTLWKLKDLETLSGNVQCITLGEYFYYKLTGQRHQSYASASGMGLMDIHQLKWDKEILSFAGIGDENQLFELVEGSYTSPLTKEAAALLGLPAGIAVTVAMPDGALNQIAAGGLMDPVMTVSVGTSGAMRRTKNGPVFSPNMETWCYYAAFKRWICGGAISGAGNCIQWFLKEYDQNLRDLEEMAAKVDRAKAPYFLPFNFGERSPGWNNKRPFGFRGEGNNTPAEYYYAVLEGILFNMKQSFDLLSSFGDGNFLVDLSGGILNSPFFAQMAADIFNKELHLNPAHHASAYGAVLMGIAAQNGEKDGAIFKNSFSGKWVKPQEDNRFYAHRYEAYLRYYSA